jgi:hypothetical protein
MKRKPYRARTWLRRWLPAVVGEHIPKGRDCGQGNHEWALLDEQTWTCLHCRQVTEENPYPPAEWARLRSAALLHDAAILLASSHSDYDVVSLVLPQVFEAEQLVGSLSTLGELEDFPTRELMVRLQGFLEGARRDSGIGSPQRLIHVEPVDEKKLS